MGGRGPHRRGERPALLEAACSECFLWRYTTADAVVCCGVRCQAGERTHRQLAEPRRHRALPPQVFTALDAFKASPPATEADLSPVQTLINEAYQTIDKAVGKGVLHRNTGARRKARLAAARRGILVAAGLYTPA